ncbi:MAG: glutathione S-transferase family protein [Alphaproteobacteria bacterium]
MLKIYTVPVSLYSAKVRIVLRHKGLDWREDRPPGGYGSAAYREVVPSGNVPTLRDGDLMIADSEAITEYLNEAYPNPAMLPGDAVQRAKTRERSRFHDTRLEPQLRALFPHFKAENRSDGFVRTQGIVITEKLQQLAHLLDQAPVRPEDVLTLADCGFPITFAWLDALPAAIGLKIDWPEPVSAYRVILESRPAVAAELDTYRPVVAAWLAQA